MESVEMLVEQGMTKTQAEAKIGKMVAALKLKGVPDPEKIVRQKVAAYVSALKRGMTQIRGICLGVTVERDVLGPMKQAALALYHEDPARALREGIVRIEKDAVVPMDMRETFGEDTGEGRKNPGYGKPMKTVMRNNGAFLIDGEVVIVQGKGMHAEIGQEYVFWGARQQDGRITGVKQLVTTGMKLVRDEVWTKTLTALQHAAMAVDIATLAETGDNKWVAVIGFIANSGALPDQGVYMTVVDYESGEEAAVFATGVTGVPEQARVIVAGRKFMAKGREGEERRPAIDAAAVVIDVSSVLAEDVTAELESIITAE